MSNSRVRRIDFSPDEFLVGVAGMTAEKIGLYWVICSLIASAARPISRTDERLCSLVKIGKAARNRAIDELIASGKLTEIDGVLTNNRIETEVKAAQIRIEKAQENGKKGGRPSNEINAVAKPDGLISEKLSPTPQPYQKVIDLFPSERIITHTHSDDFAQTACGATVVAAAPAGARGWLGDPDPKPKGPPRELIERAWAAFWKRYPSRGPHGNPKKPAHDKFVQAMKRGADPDAIMRGVENYAKAVAAAGVDFRHVAQAATWINQERWNDYQAVTATRRDDGMC
jgi:hypothetical protein